MQIQNFNCFKVEKKKDTQPDYRLSAKVGDEFVEIGAGWRKGEGDKQFISFKLTEPYEARNGYHIEVDLAPKQPVKPKSNDTDERDQASGNPHVAIEYPEASADEIPF